MSAFLINVVSFFSQHYLHLGQWKHCSLLLSLTALFPFLSNIKYDAALTKRYNDIMITAQKNDVIRFSFRRKKIPADEQRNINSQSESILLKEQDVI